MSTAYEFFSKVSPDGWMSFFGSLVGAFVTIISILIAVHTERKHTIREKKEKQRSFHNRLLESLPSIDTLCTQADYFDDEDGLLGRFSDAESKIRTMNKRINSESYSKEEKENYKYKIKRHEEYLKYWNEANQKINDFMERGSFNVIKTECESSVIAAYYDFVIAFQNEHFYSGPIITTEILRKLMNDIVIAIEKAYKS